MNDTEFYHQILSVFQRLEENLEHQLDNQCDIDGREESLQVTLSSGEVWLLNRHGPTQELWLSSPLKGGIHFRFESDLQKWISTRLPQDELIHFLEKDISSVIGFPLHL